MNKEKEKIIKKKLFKNAIYLTVAAIFLGFVIFISVWEETKDGNFGWYYFISIFFFFISLVRVLLAYYELKIYHHPELRMRR